jgi:hypothetical protein
MTRLAPLLTTRTTAIWFLLVLATLTTWRLGTEHGLGSHEAASVAIVVIAFVKVRLVGLYFMELRHAPVALRSLFEGYCLAVCTLVLAMYLTT